MIKNKAEKDIFFRFILGFLFCILVSIGPKISQNVNYSNVNDNWNVLFFNLSKLLVSGVLLSGSIKSRNP